MKNWGILTALTSHLSSSCCNNDDKLVCQLLLKLKWYVVALQWFGLGQCNLITLRRSASDSMSGDKLHIQHITGSAG